MDFQTPLNIFGIFAGLGVTSAGIGFAYSQFTSGSSKAKDDLIRTLRETAAAEKDKAERLAMEKTTLINSHQKQINDLTEKFGKLQGLFEASEKQKVEYLQILQGKNPEQVQYMADMRAFTLGVAKYMENSSQILSGIKTWMGSMNATMTTKK